jgi:hypothetical protein
MKMRFSSDNQSTAHLREEGTTHNIMTLQIGFGQRRRSVVVEGKEKATGKSFILLC